MGDPGLPMERFDQRLTVWKDCLCHRIELAALITRNPVAHKWKATYRSIVLRELVLWRMQDLLSQAVTLAKQAHFLGAVLLLRSAIETLAVLIYLNQQSDAVVRGDCALSDFAKTTEQLMLGSKDQSTTVEAVNILTVLKHSNRKYPGLIDIYNILSESAHPNYDGVCEGYSHPDEEHFTTVFGNGWVEKYETRFADALAICISVFESEYNDVWKKGFERLEAWLVSNEARLSGDTAQT